MLWERANLDGALTIISPPVDTEKRLTFGKHGRSILQPVLSERRIDSGRTCLCLAMQNQKPGSIRVDKTEEVSVVAEGKGLVLHSC